MNIPKYINKLRIIYSLLNLSSILLVILILMLDNYLNLDIFIHNVYAASSNSSDDEMDWSPDNPGDPSDESHNVKTFEDDLAIVEKLLDDIDKNQVDNTELKDITDFYNSFFDENENNKSEKEHVKEGLEQLKQYLEYEIRANNNESENDLDSDSDKTITG